MREILHRNSTLFGFLAAAAVAALLGALTNWSWPVMVFSAFGSVFILPRAFYGKAASRALDEAPATPDSFWAQPGHGELNPDMADIGTKSPNLEPIYEAKRSAAHGESTMLPSRRAKITTALHRGGVVRRRVCDSICSGTV